MKTIQFDWEPFALFFNFSKKKKCYFIKQKALTSYAYIVKNKYICRPKPNL